MQHIQHLKQQAQSIDIHGLQRKAQSAASAAASKLQSAAGAVQSAASDLMDKVAIKEVVQVDGEGPFMLVRQLAEGGFGFVFLARHTQTHQPKRHGVTKENLSETLG